MRRNTSKGLMGLLAVLLFAAVAPAMAAVPAGFNTAVTQYQQDVVAGIGLLIAAGIIVYGAKKLGQKLGLL